MMASGDELNSESYKLLNSLFKLLFGSYAAPGYCPATFRSINQLAKSTQKLILPKEKRTPHCRLAVVQALVAVGGVHLKLTVIDDVLVVSFKEL